MMANTLVFLLLLGAFSSAQAQDVFRVSKEESEHHDIQALLQDVSTALTEYKEKIEQLQTLSQEQASKLKDLEQTSKLDSTKPQLQAALVAFSASFLASGYGTIGPYSVDAILPFRYVFTNIGSAYNPNTGYFTAPVRGAYHFEFYIGSLGSPYYGSAVALVMNGVYIFSSYEQQSSGFSNAANGVTLPLNPGDNVHLRLYRNTIMYDNSGTHLSTFSGHLLFAY